MTLADKIMELRKRAGWSQEDLAERLGVSRQAVSKWESAASTPDLDRIIKLSELFGVSTDELLKNSVSIETVDDTPTEKKVEEAVHTISLEETESYLTTVHWVAGKIALGVSLCILSPVGLLCLAGLAKYPGGYLVPENVVALAGVPLLLLFVAAAVVLFLFYGRRLEAWEYLEKEPIELTYGVREIVEKRKEEYESAHTLSLMIGVVLCILAAIPIVIAVALEKEQLAIFAVGACLILVAIGAFLIVKSVIRYGVFQRLLEQGDFTRAEKLENQRNQYLGGVYWCLVTALYLGWSFVTMDWGRTWIIWPCAGVLFGAVCGIASIIRKKRR